MADFFTSMSKIATPFIPALSKKDPIQIARVKFMFTCDVQLKLIKDGQDKGYWFKKNGDAYIITLKNGPARLNSAAPSYQVINQAHAVMFIEGAKKACNAGEFDAYFKATQRSSKADKVNTVAISGEKETIAAQNGSKTSDKASKNASI